MGDIKCDSCIHKKVCNIQNIRKELMEKVNKIMTKETEYLKIEVSCDVYTSVVPSVFNLK